MNIRKILTVSSFLATGLGIILILSGAWGVYFTFTNIAREKIITPSDAQIPSKLVRGPLTLKSQADIIREHTLEITGGKTFAEMPQEIPKLTEDGQPVLDADGNQIMTANTARNIWTTATTLTTALSLGILTYAFSGLVLVFGFITLWMGVVFWALRNHITTIK
jgi:fatty acid desaturase